MAEAHNNRKKPIIPVPSKNPNTSGVPRSSTLAAPNSENTVSMIFGAVVLGIILLLGVSFWRDWRRNQAEMNQTTPTPTALPLVEVEELPSPDSVQIEQNEAGEAIPVNLPAKYTVKTGDSTWKIAEAFYGSGFNYVDIEMENQLQPDQDLVEGMELTIPRVPVRKSASARPAGSYQVSPGKASGMTGPSKGDTSAEMTQRQEAEAMPTAQPAAEPTQEPVLQVPTF